MLMLRGLLADRFKLKVHGETREAPIYALVLARDDGKLGPKLSKSTDDCEKILAERRTAAAAARAGGGGPVPFMPPGPNEKPVCTLSMRPFPVQRPARDESSCRRQPRAAPRLADLVDDEQSVRRSHGPHRPLRFRAAVLDDWANAALDTSTARAIRRQRR